MIHYTLLPEKEMKGLKREYKARLLILLLFFISCGVMIGVITLVPTYIISRVQEKSAVLYIQSVQDDQDEIESVTDELAMTTRTLKKIKANYGKSDFSNNIYEIISSRGGGVTVTSFRFGDLNTASSTIEVVIQGKASTRDTLVDFKKSLEDNPKISDLELPVSDLAKSTDISFSMRFNIVSLI